MQKTTDTQEKCYLLDGHQLSVQWPSQGDYMILLIINESNSCFSIGGCILDFAVSRFKGIAVFQPVINGKFINRFNH